MRSHSQAKRRVLYFLAVFIATGIASEMSVFVREREMISFLQMWCCVGHLLWLRVLSYTKAARLP